MSNNRFSWRRPALGTLCVAATLIFLSPGAAASDVSSKRIVLLAGAVHQGPGGHPPGTHEYELTARLLKRALADANVEAQVDIYFAGWPRDANALDTADTIVVISDGADRDPLDHPLLVGDRLATLKKQMDRGCGLVAIHWTTFVPNDRGGPEFLEWLGGYFDYQSGQGERPWFSRIQTAQTRTRPTTPSHPIARGLAPFELREEYYYNIRFRENDPRLVPILATPIPGEVEEQVVAWAVERKDGGRGFGFTGGHFFENWGIENFRRMVLNAILWTAHLEVPERGVRSSTVPTIDPAAAADDKPIQAVIVTGHQHPAHLWRDTTPALQEALLQDNRFQVTVVTDPEFLASPELSGYDLVALNYCNWQRPGLSDAAKNNFQKYLASGGGLVLVHFSNGAFHASLPDTPPSDWPEYRSICRRVWDHAPGRSGHDPYGPFTVNVVVDHPITAGLNSFETIDELYCNQQGDAPIEVLATARSTVTGRDEPLAFVYDYGRGRVFQTVLGHAAESIRVPGTAALLRRGAVWAAGHEQRALASQTAETRPSLAGLASEGKFGAALDARRGAASAAHDPIYDRRPLTVECWARLDGQAGFNILVASNSKESADHWELYTYAGAGDLSLYLPGCSPAEIRSGVDVVDGKWHHLAAAFDDQLARLYVDGRMVHETSLVRVRSGGATAPLHFGGYPPHNIGCEGLVDEVRISTGLRAIDGLPEAPPTVGASTLGLWRFDRLEADQIEDASPRKNAASAGSRGGAIAPMFTRRAADPALRLRAIDLSADESFLSLRTDTMGRLFAGGREALFVYEPDGGGGYGSRQLLYRFPPDTWITDIEIRGDDLYAMTNAALYRFAGGRVRREGLQPERLLWGSPVDLHVTWHGLAWGPEGDLYFSSGDPLLNYGDFQRRPDHWGHWTIYGPNEKLAYTGVGGFYRCRPDGTGLRVVAGGTRGAVGIAFDRRWNLFSNDNDHEGIADRYSPARLLHVAPRSHFFWPRGWIASMSPERSDLLEVMNTDMGREVPVGQAYLDESTLGERYTDSVIVARWGQRRVSGYRLVPRGASYRGEEYTLLAGEELARPVGVTVGRGGRIFVALSYMAGNEWSPKYPSEIVLLEPATPSAEAIAGYDAPAVSSKRLWSELESGSALQRQQAHVELLRRGEALLDEATARLENARDDNPALVSLIWLSAASGSLTAEKLVARFASHEEASVRATAIRALHAFPELGTASGMFEKALDNPAAAVRHAAIVALFDQAEPLPEALFHGPAREDDTYLRQAATMLIARRGTREQIERLLASENAAARLAGVLATGFRLTVPLAVGDLPAELPLKYESGNAEFTIQYPDAKIDLKALGRMGSFTTAERWKHVPHTEEEQTLLGLLLQRLADADDRVYDQAAFFLNLFDVAEINQRLETTRRERWLARLTAAQPTEIDVVWTIGPFADGEAGLDAAHPPEQGPIDLAADYSTPASKLTWREAQLNKVGDAANANRNVSSYAYFRLQSRVAQPVLLNVVSSGPIKLWHNGRAVDTVAPIVVSLDAGSNDMLLRGSGGSPEMPLAIRFQAVETVAAALPEKLGLATLAERLKNADPGDRVPPEFLNVDWSTAANTGDPNRGRKLFGADALGCVKCHAVLEHQQGGGAPSLAGAAKRFTSAHLVESILTPSKQVAPIFGTTTVVTDAGQSLSGLLVEEDDTRIVLLLPTAVRQEVLKRDIEARRLHSASPMPSGLVKTPAELADLLAYLLSENPQAP